MMSEMWPALKLAARSPGETGRTLGPPLFRSL